MEKFSVDVKLHGRVYEDELKKKSLETCFYIL